MTAESADSLKVSHITVKNEAGIHKQREKIREVGVDGVAGARVGVYEDPFGIHKQITK